VYRSLWLIDLSTGARSRFLSGSVQSMVWAADGRSIIYRSLNDGREAIYRKSLGVAGEESIISESMRFQVIINGRF
jgi:Tol biopolymer transport system component